MPHHCSTPCKALPSAVNLMAAGVVQSTGMLGEHLGSTQTREHSSACGPPLPTPISAQVNFPPAVSTMEAARICVCSPTKGMSTVPAEGAGSSRTTSPAGVRKQVGAGTGAAVGYQHKTPAQATRLSSGWAATHETSSLPSCELLLSGTR